MLGAVASRKYPYCPLTFPRHTSHWCRPDGRSCSPAERRCGPGSPAVDAVKIQQAGSGDRLFPTPSASSPLHGDKP